MGGGGGAPSFCKIAVTVLKLRTFIDLFYTIPNISDVLYRYHQSLPLSTLKLEDVSDTKCKLCTL